MTIVSIRQYVALIPFERKLAFEALRRRVTIFAFAILINAPYVDARGAEELYGAAPKKIKEYLDRLVRSYPDKISSHDGEFLILKNGMKFRISDGRTPPRKRF